MQTTVLTIDEELQNRIAELNETQKKSILELIKSFIREDTVTGQPQTIEEYNKEIEEAEKRIDAGEFYTQEEMEVMF